MSHRVAFSATPASPRAKATADYIAPPLEEVFFQKFGGKLPDPRGFENPWGLLPHIIEKILERERGGLGDFEGFVQALVQGRETVFGPFAFKDT